VAIAAATVGDSGRYVARSNVVGIVLHPRQLNGRLGIGDDQLD
jgi:hypothetical protein